MVLICIHVDVLAPVCRVFQMMLRGRGIPSLQIFPAGGDGGKSPPLAENLLIFHPPAEKGPRVDSPIKAHSPTK